MDGLIILAILAALAVLFGPWVLFLISSSRRKSDRLDYELRFDLQQQRLTSLENEVRMLKGSTVAAPVVAPPPPSPPATVPEEAEAEPVAPPPLPIRPQVAPPSVALPSP